jgi:F-type H+-transporting ATPase subunit gamma
MASTTALKRRITSVKNTKQITKAMELVAASKMRRAQEAAIKSRDYRHMARELLTRLRELTDVDQHPLFKKRTIKTKLYILVTSDRGLAGAYNSNLFRLLTAQLKEDEASKISSQLISIGKQGSKFVSRLQGVEVIGAYDELTEHPAADDLRPILKTVIEAFTKKRADSVEIIYTDYKSSIRQEVTVEHLLPAAFTATTISEDLEAAIFEPSPEVVLQQVTERLVEVQLWQAVLEAQASEHSMRMLAMKNASDNATEIIDDLTLEFNTARQAAITQELAEITGGAEAMK